MSNCIKFTIGLLLVIGSIVTVATVTVNPLCPTNKIAPHRRVPRYDNNQARTFGAFYSLLGPDDIHNAPSSLQEKPQADDPDDCGEIEDYDENDLSSLTSQTSRKSGRTNHKLFGWLNPFNFIARPTTVKSTSVSYKPTRPPAGGYFGNNYYAPPKPQEPTDHVKPVHEVGDHQNVMYRPGLVGGPLNHIVGLHQVSAQNTRHHSENKKHNVPHSSVHTTTSRVHTNSQTQKHNQPRNFNGDGVLSSFFGLLFK